MEEVGTGHAEVAEAAGEDGEGVEGGGGLEEEGDVGGEDIEGADGEDEGEDEEGAESEGFGIEAAGELFFDLDADVFDGALAGEDVRAPRAARRRGGHRGEHAARL